MLQEPRGDTRPFWKRHLRAILWGIAIAGLAVSVATRFKVVFLFLPLMFAPALFGSRDDDDRRE